ncbi:MAG: 4Fe-4S dicluster domain-containing protein [Deltaproteobacteria bacterium]|nr:MAG: 4Fe-4S dicluster domain-containing protein [Deltaproteobacteria bacterium]
MTNYAMVIDLQRCVGCGACVISCKNENNVEEGIFWSNRIVKTVGRFPEVRFEYIPTLCNHCEKAPCVQVCPSGAMYKENSVTLHDPDICIGCRYCMNACPYHNIWFNWKRPHERWRANKTLIEGCTSSPQELVKKVGAFPPYSNPDLGKKSPAIRPKGVVEKCNFCYHRITKGELPYCVVECPPDARIFGNLDDPKSKVSYLLGKYRPFRLREHLGTKPKIFYIRNFNPGHYTRSKGGV